MAEIFGPLICGLCVLGFIALGVNFFRVRRNLEKLADEVPQALGLKSIGPHAAEGTIGSLSVTIALDAQVVERPGAPPVELKSLWIDAKFLKPLPFSFELHRNTAFDLRAFSFNDPAFDDAVTIASGDEAHLRPLLASGSLRLQLASFLKNAQGSARVTHEGLNRHFFVGASTTAPEVIGVVRSTCAAAEALLKAGPG